METSLSTDDFVRELARRHRVLMLGGMAIIAHGLSRPTKDSDVWLEPFASAEEWSRKLNAVVTSFKGTRLWSLPQRRVLMPDELMFDVDQFGVVRIEGLTLPLDVFRKPNELETDDFERAWKDARALKEGAHLPSAIDLYVTKANTGREQDWNDQLFLESLVKKQYQERLPVCEPLEAQLLLGRFLDPECLQFALENPNAEVWELALKHLHQFESEGDPYSRDILVEWRKKNPA